MCINRVITLILPQKQKMPQKPGPYVQQPQAGVLLVKAEPQRTLRKGEKTAKAKEVSSLLGPKHLRAEFEVPVHAALAVLPRHSQSSRRYIRQVYTSLYSMCS